MRGRVLAAIWLLLSVGCGDHSSHAPGSGTVPPAESAAQSSTPAAELETASENPGGLEVDEAALLSELTQVVRRYSVERRKAPKGFEELVEAGYLSRVPSAPPGKRFVISRSLQVQLAD